MITKEGLAIPKEKKNNVIKLKMKIIQKIKIDLCLDK